MDSCVLRDIAKTAYLKQMGKEMAKHSVNAWWISGEPGNEAAQKVQELAINIGVAVENKRWPDPPLMEGVDDE